MLADALPKVTAICCLCRREEFLLDEEFVSVFGIDKAAFRALSKYRRIEMKKAAGLF